jgi:hypothetical protein
MVAQVVFPNALDANDHGDHDIRASIHAHEGGSLSNDLNAIDGPPNNQEPTSYQDLAIE